MESQACQRRIHCLDMCCGTLIPPLWSELLITKLFSHLYQALYLISNDRTFEEIGPTSGISYANAYTTYKERIELHAESPRFRDLIKKWNMRIFGTETESAGAEATDSHGTIEARLAAMNAELFDDPGSEYGSDADVLSQNQNSESKYSHKISSHYSRLARYRSSQFSP